MRVPRLRRSGVCSVVAVLTLCAPAQAADQRLVTAARKQDGAMLRVLLKQHVDVNAPAPDGATALHWVAHWNDLDAADLLLRAGARPDAVNAYGVMPLIMAARNGSGSMVERLLAAHADAGAALPTGETALMAAARAGSAQAVKALLTYGADVNAVERGSQQTALMWATAEGQTDVARLLIERGAQVQGRSKAGFTPLLFAVRGGSLEMTKLLVDAGANVNDTAGDGTAALLLATVFAHEPVAEYLLDRGADPNSGGAGFTALHWAAGRWESSLTFTAEAKSNEWYPLQGLEGEAKIRLIRSLLAHGANPNARTTKNPARHGGSSSVDTTNLYEALIDVNPFLIAAAASDAAAMRILAAAGADTMHPTRNGMTPLMMASGLGWLIGEVIVTDARAAAALEAVKVAVELGGDVNAKSESGDTALMGAVVAAMDKVVLYLAQRGADVNARNLDDESPLILSDGRGALRAGHRGNSKVVNDLLKTLGAIDDDRYSQSRIRFTDLLFDKGPAGKGSAATDEELQEAKKNDPRAVKPAPKK